jgi:hypothetical protein
VEFLVSYLMRGFDSGLFWALGKRLGVGLGLNGLKFGDLHVFQTLHRTILSYNTLILDINILKEEELGSD